MILWNGPIFSFYMKTSQFKQRFVFLNILPIGASIFTTYLIRINFRADKFSRTCSARKLEIFARIYFRVSSDFEILKTWYMAIQTKNRGYVLRKFISDFFCAQKWRNSVLIFAQFRANWGFARKCAKISTNEVELSLFGASACKFKNNSCYWYYSNSVEYPLHWE